MSNIFVNDWTAFAEECHQQQRQQARAKAKQMPMPKLNKNEYPTQNTREDFSRLALSRVDTLINNMRVTSGSSPKFRREVTEKEISLSDNAITALEKVVISAGGKLKVMAIRQPSNGKLAFIDWVTFSFHVATINPKYVRDDQDDDEYMAMCQNAVADLNSEIIAIFGEKYAVTKQNQSGRNLYKYSFEMGDNFGFVAIGGQRNTVSVVLNGTGCSMAQKGWEYRLHEFLTQRCQRPKITRVDLAHDDLKGEYLDVYELDKLESAGGFHCGGAMPEVHHMGNWKHGDKYNKGLTLAIGNRSSGKYTRFYQKGKKEGDKQSLWTRAEVEFKSADRVIPFDVLIEPSGYFIGAYPCFKTLFQYEKSERIKTKKKNAEINLAHAFEWIRNQTGGYLNFLSNFWSPEQLLNLLKKGDEGYIPKRLILVDDWCKSENDDNRMRRSSDDDMRASA